MGTRPGMKRIAVVVGVLAVVVVSGVVGTALAAMSLCRGDGPEFPY